MARRLSGSDAVFIGLGSMIGAGVFAAIGPAARAAGGGLLVGLGIAAVVAFCNATSSAQLAALYPASGGTYVYGRERLGSLWGFLAGWGFLIGKTASCAAIALTFGSYAVGGTASRWLALAAVVVLTGVNLLGVRKTSGLTKLIVVLVLAALALVVVACLAGGAARLSHIGSLTAGGVRGTLQSAGLMFFAFAGYARIATLGEEVVEPERSIPRAIPIALLLALAVYVVVGVSALVAIGPRSIASSHSPLADAVRSGSLSWAAPAVRVGAAVATLGVLLSLLAGVSRTAFAMASNGDLPRSLDAVHPRSRVPDRAELMIAIAVIAAVLTTDLRGAIGFSSFAVLVYYAIANASAWTLSRDERRWSRLLSGLGLVGCLTIAFSLPISSVVGGLALLAIGTVVWLVTKARRLGHKGGRTAL
ncbi:MAG: APC family permease [Actinomycetota bacterium]